MQARELSNIPLFTGVATAVLAAISRLLTVRAFLPREVMFRDGDSADELFVILHGHVEVEIEGTFLVPRHRHEIVGEQGLLNGGRRTATVTAQSLVSALAVPREAFTALLDDRAFLLNLARALSSKLTEATGDRAFHYSREARVFGEFRAHVAGEVLDRLLEDPDRYGAPRRADVIVLFSDIRDFTRITSQMDPHDMARHLSPYLNHVVDLVHQHDGMVDKFVGDAVMAVWGAFDGAGPMRAHQAFDCACRMIRTARDFFLGDEPIRIGVGLNAGSAFVGNVGGEGKRQFTVLGATVNLASRYEAKTKDLGTPLLLGPDFEKQLAADVRRQLKKHPGVEIKGAGAQDLSSFDPLAGVV
jgi:class 3 adenylate cyclase